MPCSTLDLYLLGTTIKETRKPAQRHLERLDIYKLWFGAIADKGILLESLKYAYIPSSIKSKLLFFIIFDSFSF